MNARDWWLMVIGAYAAMSIVTYMMFLFDKRRATEGGRRVPERTLHLMSMFGGWPGALVARVRLRHKTRKRGFSAVLWMIAVAHAAAWGLAVWFVSQ